MALANSDRCRGPVPVVGFCAPSGTGKTTLARYVIGLLSERGLRVGVIKQARDDFDVDQPGKDSHRLRAAGVERLLLGSERQSALIVERDRQQEPELDELIGLLQHDALDVILIEGYSDAQVPKIELYRSGGDDSQRCRPRDAYVIAIATDDASEECSLPVLDINDPWQVTEFIVGLCKA